MLAYQAPDTVHSDLLDVVQEISRAHSLQHEIFQPAHGNMSSKVFVGKSTIIKLPLGTDGSPADASTIRFEAMIVEALQSRHTEPPIALPTLLFSNSIKPPYYNIFSKVPGALHTPESVRDFRIRDQQHLGNRIGTFVGWMADTIKPELYAEIVADTQPILFDRADSLRQAAGQVRHDTLPSGLGRLLLDLQDEFEERTIDGSLQPSLIGHDDLSACNITFAVAKKKRKIRGIFDFGLTKPSSPERELRFLAPTPKALGAGIAAYESTAQQRVRPELVRFWALAQYATNFAGMIQVGNMSGANQKRLDIERIIPGIEWD